MFPARLSPPTNSPPSSLLLFHTLLVPAWILLLSPGGARMGLPLIRAQPASCHQPGVTCIPLSGPGTAPPTCYGASLRFSYTALVWANDSGSLVDVTARLRLWEGLSSVPECWAVVQPFLCSVYLPKCDNDNGRVDYPSLELCEKTREPCKAVRQFAHDWPEFLRCSQPYFKQNCGTGAYDQLSYNSRGRCQAPLVRTEKGKSWWSGLEGCGVQCRSPLYSAAQHQQAHTFVAVMGCLCLMSTLFTIITFMIDWENANRYPALILFFINVCFLLATVGWMAQFVDGAREDIVCRVDGTARKTEPQLGSGETAACTVVFVMIYYFTMAALLWFVMLCYSWHVTFRALGTPRDDLSSKTAYFHLVSWSIPLVLTIVCLAISEIDGDYLSGICFVGYHNHSVRAGFVLVPVASVLIVGLFFLSKGLLTLMRIKKDVPEFVGEKAASKIRGTIIRIGVFLALALLFGVITFAIHIYIFVHETQWTTSLNNYLTCLTNRTVVQSVVGNSRGSISSVRGPPEPCTMENGPSLVAMLLNIFTFFGTGIIMSSWSWTIASLSAWTRLLTKAFRKTPKQDQEHSEQHQMMVPGSGRRHDGGNGRHSFSYHSTHDDPLDIASVMSRRLSQGSHQYADLQGKGQYVYMERDNSSNNGSQFGGWRRRRRRRRKRRKKRSIIQPILGPLLSGVGFRPIKAAGADATARRASESSLQASVRGGGSNAENPMFRRGGSSSSLPGFDPLLGGSVSGTDAKSHPGRSRRRKLPRLAPLSQQRLRSLSSSRSSLTQFGLGSYAGMHSSSYSQPQYPAAMYPPIYGGYDYSQYYASLGYPQVPYPPYWPPYPYPQYPQPPPPPPPPPGPGSDFSNAQGGGSVPRATSTPDMERKRVVTASTSRRSEVTIETQQTETISMQTLKTGSDLKKSPQPVSDDSIEDLNSSGLEDSAAEKEDEEEEEEAEEEEEENDSDNDTTAGEAEDEV
ncbi:hypothetical protein ACOMHN_019520 [Nucella lapillus]